MSDWPEKVADELALKYWNSVRANYPNLQPDSPDFWEACPTHLSKVVAEALRAVYRETLAIIKKERAP